jgi:hypothetical protein
MKDSVEFDKKNSRVLYTKWFPTLKKSALLGRHLGNQEFSKLIQEILFPHSVMRITERYFSLICSFKIYIH